MRRAVNCLRVSAKKEINYFNPDVYMEDLLRPTKGYEMKRV